MKCFFMMILIALIAPAQAQEEGTEKWFNSISVGRGHEDLTRMGVDSANEILQEKGEKEYFYPRVPYGDAGLKTRNPLVKGNFSTDFPNLMMRAHYEPISSRGSWGSNTRLQILHFLRNYSGGDLMGLKEACHEGRNLIVKNTLWAFTHYQQTGSGTADQRDLQFNFHFWLGHVLHTIQDSFSPSHLKRALPDFRRIKDICVYGRRFSSVCHHKKFDLRDRIWNKNLKKCFIGPYRGRACLNGRAKAAVDATAGYLLAVAELTREFDRMRGDGLAPLNQAEWEATVSGQLQAFFTNDQSPYSGYFNCPNNP